MSRRIDTSIASVQFQVDARQASASMQALQDMANRLNKDIDSVNKNIANLGKDVPKDNPQLLAYQQQLNALNSDLKDVMRTQKDFMRGAKAADQLWKAAGDGTIESLSFRSIRTGINGLKKRQEGLQPGDAQDMKDYRIIKQVIEEADRVVKAAGNDVQNVVQTIREGGKVSEQTMRQTINTLKDLKGSVDETEAEFRAWGSDLDFMEAKMQEFNEAQRRAKGEIVDANDARREMNKLTVEGAAAAEKEAKAAEQKIASLKEEGRVLAENRTQIKKNIEATQEQMDKMQEDIERKHNYVESLGGLWAEDQKAIYEGNVNDAKRKAQAERELANQKSDAAENQKRYTEVLTQKTEELEQKVAKLNEQLTAVQQQKPAQNPVLESVSAGAEKASVDVDALKKKLDDLATEKRQLEGKMSDFKFDEDMARAYKPFEDVFNRLQSTFEKIEQLPKITGRMITMGDGSPFKKSMMSAKFYSKGDIDFDTAYAQKEDEITRVMQDIKEHEAGYLGNKSFLTSLKKDYESIRDAVSYGKRLQGIEGNMANPEVAAGLQRRVDMMEKLKVVYKEIYDLALQHGRTIHEKYGNDIYEERIDENAREKVSVQKRLNEINQESVGIQKQIVEATQQSTQATKNEAEATKQESQELEQIERKLKNIADLRKEQQKIIDDYEAKYGKTSDEQYEARHKIELDASQKDVAAQEAAVEKVNKKWDNFWKNQEAAAQEFARSLGKSLDEIAPEDITSEQLSGPLAKSAQAAYKVTARRDYEFSEALGREGKLTEYKETARRYEGDDSPEAKVIESLTRKYREYVKELNEATTSNAEAMKVHAELREESDAYISALGQMQGLQKVENDLLQQKDGILKQTAETSKEQTEAIQKKNQELERTKSYIELEKGNISRNQQYYDQAIKDLKEMGLAEKDITDQAKIQEAIEKKTLEIMEAEVNAEKEAAEHRRNLVSKITSSQLGGSKADQEFYAKHAGEYELSQYKDTDEMMERIAHLEMVSKLKNGQRFSDDTYLDPEDEVDKDELYVMTDEEKKAALNELRILKQHIREELLKTLNIEGDLDKAVQELTGGDGFSEDAKFGEQLNDKIQSIKEKIDEKIQTSLDKYDNIVNMEYSEAWDDNGKLDKEKVRKNVAEYIGDTIQEASDSMANIKESQDTIKEYEGDVTRLNGEIGELTQATKEQTEAQAESHKQDEEELRLKGELEKTQKDLTISKENQNKAEQESIRLQGEAAEQDRIAAKAESDLAEAESTLVEKQAEVNRQQDETLAEIGKMGEEYEGLKTKMEGYEQQLEDNGKAYAENAQQQINAEAEKAQAQQLTIKRMEEMLAALRKENSEVIPANTEKWRENEAEINRLSGTLEKLKETARIDLIKTQGQEALSFFEKDTAGRSQADTASAAETAEKVKALAAYRDVLPKDTDVAVFARIDEILEEQAKLLKETTGEWMSYDEAKELASKAGTDGFIATTQQMQQAVQAMERQRDALIKTIQLKQKDGKATADEEAQLDKLEKELKDLKFEQDNFNMSHKHMQDLLNEPIKAENLDELKVAIKRADGELKRMEGSLGKNNKEYKAFAEQVRNAKNQLKEMEGQAKASATAWEKAWSRLKTYVVMYMGFNAVWQKMMGTADDLMQLSDKMGEVRKTTGFTADEVGRLSDNLAKLDTRTSLTGLMEFSSLAGSIGMKTQEDVQGFTEAANMLAVSLPEMGNEASRTLMKIADATGDLEKNGGNVRETLERVGSTIIALRANSAAAAGPITDFVSRVGAVGAQAGISIDQIAALGATVDALGGRVEMSATALSRMIPAIKNNTFEVAKAIGMTEKELKNMTGMEQMVAIFRKLHDSAKGFDTSTEEGMNAMADSVEKALGRSTSMQEVMKELNQQGARAGIVFGLLSQNVDKLEKQLDTASNAYKDNIALMNEYNKMNDTTAAKWEKLKNQLEEAFVSDFMQRLLGGIIEGLRYLVDFITGNVTGVFKTLNTVLFTLAAGFLTFKSGIGAALVSIGGLSKALSNFRVAITLAIGDMGRYIQLLWASKFALDEEARAAAKARLATMGATKAMMANVVMAFVAAIAMLAWKLYSAAQAAKEAAAETGRFNQQIYDEQQALNKLFDPLSKSNLAQDERSKLISEINSKYSKYLGYMLSETTTAIQLADAHALIAKRIREEAYERRIAEQEQKIMEEHNEDVNAAYTRIGDQIRSGVKGNADAQTMADMLKGIVDESIRTQGHITGVFTDMLGRRQASLVDPTFYSRISSAIERLVVDGKLSSDHVSQVREAVIKYTAEAQSQHDDIMQVTANVRSDLRGVQNAIKVDLSNNLNTLISNVANSVSNAVKQVQNKQQPRQQSPYLQSPGSSLSKIPSLFGGGQQGGKNNRETTPEQQMAPAGWKSNINKKDVNAVRQFVQGQEALRGALKAGGQQIDEAQRRVAESWLVTDKELKEYKAIIEKADRGPGGGNNNPYGDYNKVTSPYSQWNGDDLVARRKEMLDRVRALANGADVQKVLSEDAKFITEATRKNIKTTEQAIEWYNTERLKIQDALHEKHLTNTGDWLDPKKGGKKASKMVQDEMKYYLDELDAYYTERKAKIQEARNDEAISEAEAWNRDIKNEAEWYRRRAELQQLYAKQSEKVTKDEMDAIFNILSERTDDSVDYIKKDIDHTVKFIEKVGKEKGKPAMDRIIGDIDLGIERAFLKQRNTLGKHLKAIEDIINKERPFNGIAQNLQKNLGMMGILTADMAEGADSAAEELKRITFLLGESENAYTMTVEKLLEDMRQNGFKEWADVISKDPSMQQGLLAMLRQTFDAVQDAIKKESSIIKKHVENMMLDITEQVQADTTHLQILQNSVERANSLIGAGTASERVADKLAMKQMQMQITFQETRIRMLKKTGADRVALLQQEADLLEKQGKKEEAKQKRMDAENIDKSVGLTLTKEQVELDKQRVSLAEKLEESQNRLYTELKSWADLLASSLQGMFEASHAGDKEYYNELAKLNLTGKGGPGAGTYIVIDNEGTEDATAHYEYLSEREALERQHEIEIENARAEAWKKMMDDLNAKMNEQITDWMNAALQNQSIDANTSAVNLNNMALNSNTQAMAGLTGQLAQGITIRKTGDTTNDHGLNGLNGLTDNSQQSVMFNEGVTPGMTWALTDDQLDAEQTQLDQRVQMQIDAAEKVRMANEAAFHSTAKTEGDSDKQMVKSTQSTFAKMTAAANLYGIAYQTMSNDNLSASEKFQMFALQAAGQAAIGMLTTNLFQEEANQMVKMPGILGKLLGEMPYPAAMATYAAVTALLGGLMGMAVSKVAKSKSQIAQVTGASASAGKLTTGMLTYAEGNVNEFTDPGSLTPGRQYNVDGRDGRTYRARYMGEGAKTHITNGPEFHLVGEKGREAIIDAHTTRNIQLNEPEIWRSIQTLYNGGSLRHSSRRRGVRAYAEGNIDEFGMADGGGLMANGSGLTPEMASQMQAALDRNSAVMEVIVEKGIKAIVSPYGPDGIVAGYDKAKKEAKRHGEKYL